MPRNHTHTSHNYSDSQKDALSKCYELESKIYHIEKWMKVAAILTLVIGAPVTLFLGIAFSLKKLVKDFVYNWWSSFIWFSYSNFLYR